MKQGLKLIILPMLAPVLSKGTTPLIFTAALTLRPG